MREKKAVKCITTGEIFASADEAAQAYDVEKSNIRKCCNGKLKIAGKLSDGTKLIWEFAEVKNGELESDRITELETRIAELEKKNEQLEKKNEQLEKKNEQLEKLTITLWELR